VLPGDASCRPVSHVPLSSPQGWRRSPTYALQGWILPMGEAAAKRGKRLLEQLWAAQAWETARAAAEQAGLELAAGAGPADEQLGIARYSLPPGGGFLPGAADAGNRTLSPLLLAHQDGTAGAASATLGSPSLRLAWRARLWTKGSYLPLRRRAVTRRCA